MSLWRELSPVESGKHGTVRRLCSHGVRDASKVPGRSIEAYHMYQGLCGVKDLLLKFGGHPMAAGFSLREEDVDEFRRRLNEQANLKPGRFYPENLDRCAPSA